MDSNWVILHPQRAGLKVIVQNNSGVLLSYHYKEPDDKKWQKGNERFVEGKELVRLLRGD